MYITPNSTIILCKNVPLDNTYEHTILFQNASSQTSYFQGKGVVTLNAQTYQRVERGKMRVQCSAEDIYTCNYLMFQNTAYGNKWFYAFITGVEYVNNVTSEITFEIDSLQTYWFDIVRKPCFVEREHSYSDVVGDNVVPEEISAPELLPGDSYFKYWENRFNQNDWSILVQMLPPAYVSMLTGDDPIKYSENQFTPLSYTVDYSNLQNLNDWITARTVAGYEIRNCYMYPKEFDTGASVIHIDDLDQYNICRPTAYPYYNKSQAPYVPKNNKLFTYPYTKLVVSTCQGETQEYKWENTREGYVKFSLYHNVANEPSCELRPNNYCSNVVNRIGCIGISNFPRVSFSQYQEMNFCNLMGMAGKIGHGIQQPMKQAYAEWENSLRNPRPKSASASDYDTGGFSTGLDVMKGLMSKPDKETGTTGSNLDVKYGTFGFMFYTMGLRGQDAEVIDNYFSKYGYATRLVKVPNVNARVNWTYTKTKGCIIVGNAPADDVRRICQIFDGGITFWNDPAHVGDYGDMTNPVRQG